MDIYTHHILITTERSYIDLKNTEFSTIDMETELGLTQLEAPISLHKSGTV